MASITVYIAGKGTPTNDSPSTLGHMWYGLTDNDGSTTYYGYHPVGDGRGEVRTNFDNTYYKSYEYSQAFTLNEQQYNAIHDFALKIKAEGGTYDPLESNCVDFVFKSLGQAGIYGAYNRMPSLNESLLTQMANDWNNN